MNTRFKSSLFVRIFATTAAVISVLFGIMYLLAVPFIQTTVEGIEESAGHTILKNVYGMVEQTHLDLENYRLSIILERKAQLRNIIAVVESHIKMLEEQVLTGNLSKEEAIRTLLEELRHIKYGHDDYVWAANYASVLISHPDPQLNNADFSSKRDLRGNLIVPPMVAGALRSAGEGFHSYWWRRLGEQQPIEKLSYYKHIPFFDLVIGTGVYMDDVEAAVRLKKNVTVEELRQRLRTTHLGKSGYVYIFDGKQNMVIHPNSNIEGKDFSKQLNPSTHTPIGSLLMAVADKEEGLRYLWDSPADPGNYVYEKISWVDHCKEFNWYICTSMYVDELDESARILRNRVVAVFAVTLLLSVLLTYLFAKKLTDPLRQLSDTARRVENGDFDARCNLNRGDEIGVVATAFNGMVSRLQDNIRHLDAKVVERTNELQILNRKLEALSTTDGLTGIANRRCFDEVLATEWSRAVRMGQPLALAMLDVDWFKQYNDHYGHQAGDECLRKVASVFAANVCRTGDLVARYGGEEFVFIAPATDGDKALYMAQKVGEALQKLALVHEMSAFGCVTISIGVAAMVPGEADAPDILVQAADAALYRAKKQGRNRVVLA
ncbi:MAG: cache domain-containing protein [Halothiobacillus sp.]|jgi:two-component system cell cycle sensor histidine kinase/response regulator CckA|nr:cache domain-containing protein [Halothiobacillus sp.]